MAEATINCKESHDMQQNKITITRKGNLKYTCLKTKICTKTLWLKRKLKIKWY